MMTSALAWVSLTSLATPALAAEAAAGEDNGSDIILTARRQDERLRNAPQPRRQTMRTAYCIRADA